jgi:HD-like signal output (HDOD) protein
VGSIPEAVTVLGFDSIRSVVISAGVDKIFPHAQTNSFDISAYWQRSFRVAAISMSLAKIFEQNPQMAFTTGMFYDIGKLVLNECIPQQFDEILQQQAATGSDLIGIERTLLDFDHAEIGAELIRLWNFPQKIEQVVRHWRQPELLTTADPMVCLVHIAAQLENGISGELLMSKLSKSCCNQTEMTWERIEACLPHPDQLKAAANLSNVG